MSSVIAPHARAVMTAREYYRHPAVRARIREYCGGTDGGPLTCTHLSALTPGEAMPTWESAAQHPPEDLDRLLDDGADVARSMTDSESLIFYLDLDYLNAEHPAEAFLHPADVFFSMEPTYRATHDVLRSFDMAPLEVVTGRGHHFAGRIPWSHPVISHLAELAPDVPAWHATIASRHPTWMKDTLDERQARAAFGLGMLTEHLAHTILRRASPRSAIPVVLNGTEVGAGLMGRACASIDLSYAGDPLDVRNIRVAFSAYQLHQLRADIFGSSVATMLPAIAAVPRAHQSLYRILTSARFPRAAARAAERQEAHLPDVAQGVAALLLRYLPSRLAAFHREYYAVTPHAPEAWPDTYDRLDPKALLPCVAWPLERPNDFLLQPARIQHLTRGLMAEGWQPRHIAGLVHSRYARDYGWGIRWSRLDARTRAEFDVRVFAGLIATGLDEGVDFNCVSAQEKGLCPHNPNCHHDLRVDRVRLLEGKARP
jgi:hypothetical protein